MAERDDLNRISEDEIESRAIERRAFLGRFAVAAGVVGLTTAGCAPTGSGGGAAGSSDECDDDPGDPVDADAGAAADDGDTDSGDECDID